MNSITKYEQQSKDLDTLRAMAAVAIRSGKYTSDYNESTVLNIFMTARALGVDPMLALTIWRSAKTISTWTSFSTT